MSYKTPKSYLPHSGAMVLIDEILEVGEDFIITKSIVKNHREFCESVADSSFDTNTPPQTPPARGGAYNDFSSLARGDFTDSPSLAEGARGWVNPRLIQDSSANLALPTYKSIELMAQSLGIFRALNEKGSGSKLGFLLGARRFKILRPFIMREARIKVAVSMQDSSGMGVYDCEVFENDALIATASISALNPSADFLSHIKGAQK